MKLQSLVGRVGGKTKLCKEIVSYFPEHRVYIEPFVGGGSVFLQKEPCEIEVINDLDPAIYYLYKDILTVNSDDFRAYKFIPSKEKFEELLNLETDDPKLRLYKNIYLPYCSFGSKLLNFNPTRVVYNREFGKYKKNHIDDYKERLSKTHIYNLDYREVIEKYDAEDALIYLDPPYSELKKNWAYNFYTSMEEVYDTVKKIKGKFILSYDNHPDVKEKFKDFFIKEVHTKYSLNNLGVQSSTKEVLISNFNLDE
jgi:DNA adenine methylase